MKSKLAGKHRAPDFVDLARQRGVSFFTTQQFASDLDLSMDAAKTALWRLRRSKRIATPLEGFHVILSPEHRAVGCLPAEEFIDALMKHVGQPYYVGLLSAAEYFGAAHQRPQIFQVVVGKKRKPIRCGKIRVDFIVRQNAKDIPCMMPSVRTGYLRLSTPEATAFDLVGYMNRAVGFNNVATVLSELSQEIHDKELGEAARFSAVAWAQRLGYLLEVLGKKDALSSLASYVNENAKRVVPLAPWRSMKGVERNLKWRVAVNESVEPD